MEPVSADAEERVHIAMAVLSLGDKLARIDERALCFDPDPEYRREIKQRLTEPRKAAS